MEGHYKTRQALFYPSSQNIVVEIGNTGHPEDGNWSGLCYLPRWPYSDQSSLPTSVLTAQQTMADMAYFRPGCKWVVQIC